MSAALTDKLLKVGVAGTLTSMSAPGKAEGASGFNIGSGSNYPTDTAFIIAVRTVDTDGLYVDGTYTEWIATISGTTVTINPVPVYGDDQVYAAGATTQVYVPLSAYGHNLLIDALLSQHDQTGALKATATVGGRIIDNFSPLGIVVPYAGSTAPTDWLLCYGQAISRSTYAGLFAILSTVYGSGDGSTTFNVPDLRGRVVAGQDDMGGSSANRLTNPGSTVGGIDGDVLGGTGGAETHVLTTAQLAAHNHQQHIDNSYNAAAGGVAGHYAQNSTGASDTQGALFTTNAGSDAAHNNVQPTLILNYIIKAL